MVSYHCFMADLADPQKRLSLMCLGIQKDRLDISKQKGNIMRILLIEDDKNLCDTLKYQLEREGILVDACTDGLDGLHYMKEDAHDMVLLDRMLPTMNGLQVLRRAREAQIKTPVIMITALGELYDKVEGLDSGADDYIVKPFEFPELLARIHSLSRRSGQWEAGDCLTYKDICYDVTLRQLKKDGHQLLLSRREGALMEFFLRNTGQTLPRGLLLSRVWGPDAEVEDGNLDNYVHFLRRRLKAVQSKVALTTVRGVGYVLE